MLCLGENTVSAFGFRATISRPCQHILERYISFFSCSSFDPKLLLSKVLMHANVCMHLWTPWIKPVLPELFCIRSFFFFFSWLNLLYLHGICIQISVTGGTWAQGDVESGIHQLKKKPRESQSWDVLLGFPKQLLPKGLICSANAWLRKHWSHIALATCIRCQWPPNMTWCHLFLGHDLLLSKLDHGP